jgi:hypothetical protein
MKKIVIALAGVIFFNTIFGISPCEAFLFHATKKAAARKIMQKGFSKAKMNPTARFGKGIYTSTNKKTAISEVGRSDAVIRMGKSKYMKKNTINMLNPNPNKIRNTVTYKDLRGTVKNKIIGPKLGREMGKSAGKQGKAIRYRSIKNPKTSNVFVPRKTYSQHPRILTITNKKDF